eukprot:3195040-Prorocentrum_lima.AAC.1
MQQERLEGGALAEEAAAVLQGGRRGPRVPPYHVRPPLKRGPGFRPRGRCIPPAFGPQEAAKNPWSAEAPAAG